MVRDKSKNKSRYKIKMELILQNPYFWLKEMKHKMSVTTYNTFFDFTRIFYIVWHVELQYNILISYDKFEDATEITRGRKSKERQYNGQQKKNTNNDPQKHHTETSSVCYIVINKCDNKSLKTVKVESPLTSIKDMFTHETTVK